MNKQSRNRGISVRIGRRKRPHEMVARTSISMPPLVLEWGNEGVKANGYGSFSHYVENLIRVDKRNRQQMMLNLA